MFCVFIDVLDCLRGMVLVHSMFREYCTRGVMHFLIIEQHRFLRDTALVIACCTSSNDVMTPSMDTAL